MSRLRRRRLPRLRGAIWSLQLWRLWLRLRQRLPDLDARGLDLDLLERDSEKPRPGLDHKRVHARP